MNWTMVDWSRPTSEIAKKLRKTLSAVSNARRRYAPHTVRMFNLAKPQANWARADWTKDDVTVARQVGASRARVAKVRAQYNIAKVPGPRGRPAKVQV